MGRSDYYERQEERIERLLSRAEAAESRATSLRRQADGMAKTIPFGQPILVGHHSEKSDRSFRNRIWNKMDKSLEEDRKAKDYKSRAAAAENNRSISSDDPEAVEKIRAKIKKLKASHETMKAANRIIRSKPKNERTEAKIEKLRALFGDTESSVRGASIENMFVPDCLGRFGFPDYALQNNNANIKRMERRLAELEAAEETAEDKETHYEGFSVIENTETNRIQIDFHSRADYFTLCKNRGINLKRYGFNFSRRDGNVWQRLLNDSGRMAAKRVIEDLTRS